VSTATLSPPRPRPPSHRAVPPTVRADGPAWVPPALAVLLVGTAVRYLWDLSASGLRQRVLRRRRPAFGLVYLVAGPTRLRTRLLQLGAALVAMVVTAGRYRDHRWREPRRHPAGWDGRRDGRGHQRRADRPAQRHVANGEMHYYIGGGQGGGPGGDSDSTSAQIAAWVAANYPATTVGGQMVYDLTA
jgi:hypothetical protein